MATLTSTKIKNTYDALLKATDNDAIGSTAKQITDGLGNGTPLYISTTQIGIGVTPEATYDLHVYSNAKVGGDLTITGDLTVNGTTTTVDTDTLRVEDPLIEVARNNTSSDAVDIGLYGKYAPSGTTLYAGLFRDAGDGKFKLFKSLQEEPTTTVNTSGTGYNEADLVIGDLEASNVTVDTTVSTSQFSASSYIVLTAAGSDTVINGIRQQNSNRYFNFQLGASGGLKSFIYDGVNPSINWLSVDTSGNATFSDNIIVTGTGSFTGQVTIPATPVASTDAASKGYVDTQVSDKVDGSGTANDVVMWLDSNTLTDAPIAISGNDATFAGNITFGATNPFQQSTNVLDGTGTDGARIRSAVSSAANPTFSNSDDTNTGMFFAAADTLGFTTGGTERMRLDSSGDLTMQGGRIYVKESDLGNNAVAITRDADEGYVQLFSSGTQTVQIRGNGDSYINGGNVGIGTTSPSVKTHIYDSSTDAVLYIDSGNVNGSHARFLASGSVKHFIGSGGGFGLGDVDDFAIRAFDNLIFATNNSSTERMRIDSSGNVGIGTTSPLTAFEVIGTDPNNNVSRVVNIKDDRSYAANVGGGISFFGKYNSSNGYSTYGQIIGGKTNATDGDYSGYLSFKTRPNNALPTERMRIDSSGDTTHIASYGGGTFPFRVGYGSYSSFTPTFVIDDNGNVGIGTTSPAVSLDVRGEVAIAYNATYGLRFYNDARNNWSSIGNNITGSSSANLVFKDATGEAMRIEGGNVGIGTTSPTYKFEVSNGTQTGTFNPNSSGFMFLGSTSNHPLYFGVNDSTKMIINTSGNVGIGKTSPSQKLDVEGSIRLNSELQIFTGTTDIGQISNSGGALNIQGTSTRDVSLGSDSYPQSVFIEGSNGRLGLGTTSPNNNLQVKTASNGGGITIQRNSTSSGAFADLMFSISTSDAATPETKIRATRGASYDDTDISFITSNSEKMRIDSSGTTTMIKTSAGSSTTPLVVRNSGSTNVGTESKIFLSTVANDDRGAYISSIITDASNGNALILATNTAGSSPTERMRINSDGDVLMNCTSVPSGSGGGAAFETSGTLMRLKQSAPSTTTTKVQIYYNSNGEVGSIHTSGSATAFNTSSDYRLKDDYKDFNGLDLVSNINVYDFKWKSDETRSYGVKAHELQKVIPQAVNGEKDGKDMQQVDYSKLVPILLKSIQELQERIQILENK